MAVDVATLAIKVENQGTAQATASLNSLAVTSDRTEKATQRLTRRMALLEIEARQMDAAMSKSKFSLASMATSMGLSETAATRLKGALGALSAIAAVGFIGRKTIQETIESQAAMAQLESAIRSTGGAAGFTAQQMSAMASDLQKVSTFSDDAIVSAQALLTSFTNIKGDNFTAATEAVVDLATRMERDLPGAAILVGKALNDPAKGLGALAKAGVQVSDSQKAVIKDMLAAGRTAEAQAIILGELERKFGGAAEAARDTLGGALKALENAWGDLFEVSSGASQGTVTAINAITTALENSGVSMNKVLHDATVDWETMRASIQKVREIMSLEIGPGFLDRARNIIQRIDFDLSETIAKLNAPAPPGPATGNTNTGGGGGGGGGTDTQKAAKDLDDLQRATDKYYATLEQNRATAFNETRAMREQNEATRAMIAAVREGPAAVEALTIAQAGENAVKELGIGVSDEMVAARRREGEAAARLAIELGKTEDAQREAARAAEEAADEVARAIERRERETRNAVMGAVGRGIDDALNRRSPLPGLVDSVKAAVIRGILEAMEQARTKEWPISTGPRGGVADASAVMDKWGVAREQFKKAMGVGASAVGGYGTGYGIGQSTGSSTLGAVGGALAGAKMGMALGGPVGALVGGVAGLAGGLLGAADAAEEARKRVRELEEAFASTFNSLRAELNKDTLGQAIAQVKAQYDAARKQGEAMSLLGGLLRDGSGYLIDYANRMRELTEMERLRIEQLKEEAAILQRRSLEDFQARRDAATPGNEREEALAAVYRQLDREREDLVRSFGTEIDEREAAILAMADQAFAAEKQKAATEALTGALNSLTTSVRNAPSGFKLEGYIQQYAKAQPYPGQMQVPINPFVPPRTPTGTPQMSQAPITLNNPTFSFPNIVDGKVAATAFLEELDRVRNSTGGLNGSRGAALEVMKVPPRTSQWRS